MRAARQALAHFGASDGYALASHVALSLMMALFPFLIFAVSLAGLVGSDGVSKTVVDLVFDYWPDAIAEPIVNEINAVVETASARFLTVGILLAVVFASNGVEAVRVALNRAYGDDDARSIWARRLQSLLFVVVGAVLISLFAVLLVFAPLYFSFLASAAQDLQPWLLRSEAVRWVTAFGLLIFVVFACHRWLPGRRRSLARLRPGIILTVVLWIVVAWCFTLYLESFANYSATYAGLSGIMTALIFMYLMAAILIFGAEYNAALARLGPAGSGDSKE